ncbi:STAS domain-containing protein [Amycolatopsis australiensis]|uniref:Anti-anti-sigma factor n=1 Tax=Amycolatopsis australiensis TaxID=546364 RepID=A0A1K1SH18_9PSEU|nr:STAS domain-containing protein [Amycolatopsis australiensis]SFW83688.1 anti-anti-sigma factor [Amycolatopsis australiensis]
MTDLSALLLTVTTAHPRRGTARVTVTGDLDMTTRPRLDAKLDEIVAELPERLELDLLGVGFCGVTGVAALGRLRAKCADAGIDLVLKPSRIVRRALDLAAVGPLFQVVNDEPELAAR